MIRLIPCRIFTTKQYSEDDVSSMAHARCCITEKADDDDVFSLFWLVSSGGHDRTKAVKLYGCLQHSLGLVLSLHQPQAQRSLTFSPYQNIPLMFKNSGKYHVIQ